MIEGMIFSAVWALLFIATLLICGAFWYLYRNERALNHERQQTNVEISNLINQLDMLNITGLKFNDGENWSICLGDLEEEQYITRLSWKRNHIFHKACIISWTTQNNFCPLWKAQIPQEILDHIHSDSDKIGSKEDQDYGALANFNWDNEETDSRGENPIEESKSQQY